MKFLKFTSITDPWAWAHTHLYGRGAPLPFQCQSIHLCLGDCINHVFVFLHFWNVDLWEFAEPGEAAPFGASQFLEVIHMLFKYKQAIRSLYPQSLQATMHTGQLGMASKPQDLLKL